MLGWMDDEALHRTLTTGRGTYWSRSRGEYWVKGETSGNTQRVVEVRLDCDGDTVLVKVDQTGPACHTGAATCFDARRPARGRPRWLNADPRGAASVRSCCSGWVPRGSPRWRAPSRGWAPSRVRAAATHRWPPSTPGTRFPLASAISLVLLAAWGVLLVTRGRVRRAFAVLATLAAAALVVSVVVAYFTLPDTARDSFDDLMGRGSQETGFTGWFWTTAVCSVVALVAGCPRRTPGAGLARDGQQVRRTGHPHPGGSRGRVRTRPLERARRGARPHRHPDQGRPASRRQVHAAGRPHH